MGRARGQQRKRTLLIAVAVLAAGIGVAAYATHLLRRSELQTIDARFSIRGAQKPPSNIVLVAIDPATFQELTNRNMSSEFPFPRRYDAEVIEHLRLAGAKVIAMDIEFTHRTDPRDDDALAEAIAQAHGKTVLGTSEVAKGGITGIFGGEPEVLRELGTRPAEVRFQPDSDGSIRRFAYSYNDLHSFAVVTTELATEKPIPASRFEDGSLPIDYVGPLETIRSIPYSSVLLNKFSRSAVQGKIVIVGATSPILQDIHATPTSEGMPGPEIWANATNTLLQGIPLRDAPGWLNLVLIVILGSVVPLGSLQVRPRRALLSSLALAAVFTIAVRVAFDSGLIVDFVYPLLALAFGTLGTIAVLYMVTTIERQHVRDMFARFVPADVVDQVVASTGEDLRLGGVERDCTILFTRARDRGRQLLPERDDRGDPRRRGDADLLHGRRDHGGVRRAAAAGRPRRPGAAGGAGDDRRAAGALQRVVGRAGPRERLRDGRRPQQRPGDGRQRRLRTARRVHDDRRHDQHRLAAGGHDEGLGAHAVLRAVHARADERPADRPSARRRARGARARGQAAGVDALRSH
jgi:CHASE2 domain-containing sensor protein